jgi:PAS domain S-box-containing protein
MRLNPTPMTDGGAPLASRDMTADPRPTLAPATNGASRHLAPVPIGVRPGFGVIRIGTHAAELRAAEVRHEASERQFRALFEGTPDAILVVDDEGRYIDSNPAASLLLGLPRTEILGRRLFDDLADFADDDALDAAWHGFLEAGSATGDVRLRRPDGTYRYAEYAATAEVVPGRHFGILRDVTDRRLTQQQAAQRARIIEAFHKMQPGPSPELTAEAICAEITRYPEVPNAAILAFDEHGTLTTLASTFAEDASIHLPREIARPLAARLRKRAAGGAWIETFDQWADEGLQAQLMKLGILAVAFAPIEVGGEVLGLLATGDGASLLDEPVMLESVEDYAALASSLLGGPLSDRRQTDADGRRIDRIIARGAFHPVFQPIVDLATDAVVGYEALTRFDGGLPPDEVFATAAGCEHGIALEVATIKAALMAAKELTPGTSIHINVSPALILANGTLARQLACSQLEIVLEITEHEQIADYSTLRHAVRDLGGQVRVAVDDAGAGFASLRHILELQPAVVKLDRALVAGIDGDPARQALVAGMVHFADGIGAVLVGEGIETEEERATLMRLGTGAGQGYLLGCPLPVAEQPAKPYVSAGTIR